MAPDSDSGADGPRAVPARVSDRERHVLEAIDDGEALEVLRELISHPSENPPGDEAGCAQFLESFLSGQGVECRLVEVLPGRPNLYARIGSSNPTLVLCGHLDTVPAGEGWTVDPFSAELAGSRVYGRGACDMKAGLASMVAALVGLKRSGQRLNGSVALHAVIDEEASSAGAKKASAEEPFDWVIVTEPSNNQVNR
jgi:succinyl-diaminopimelate desuccinylase